MEALVEASSAPVFAIPIEDALERPALEPLAGLAVAVLVSNISLPSLLSSPATATISRIRLLTLLTRSSKGVTPPGALSRAALIGLSSLSAGSPVPPFPPVSPSSSPPNWGENGELTLELLLAEARLP
jgi:hypothetical protein